MRHDKLFLLIFTGLLLNKVGRKKTLLFTSILDFIGWLCITASGVFTVILLGRGLVGIALGGVAITIPVYVSEVSPKDSRGLMMGTCSTMVTMGVLLSFVMGKWLPYNWLAAACIIPSVLVTPVLPWLADSPRWLLQVGQEDEARLALLFYGAHNVTEEYEAISWSVLNARHITIPELKHVALRRPFLVIAAILFLQQVSGIGTITFNTYDIFARAGLRVSPVDSSIVVAAVCVVSSTLGALLTDGVERRLSMLFSLTVCGVSLVTLGVFYHYKRLIGDRFADTYSWLPLLSLCVYTIAYFIALGPVPYVMIGEMFALNVRGAATAALLCIVFLCEAVVVRTYHDMLGLFGEEGLFWFYACFMFAGLPLVALGLPETKGKSLEEIELLHLAGEEGKTPT